MEQGPRVVSGGVGFAAEHAGDFIDPRIAFDFLEFGKGAVLSELFGDDKLFGSECGDLREMADAEDLVGCGELPHFGSDGLSDFATDVGIDFVENEEGNGILSC